MGDRGLITIFLLMVFGTGFTSCDNPDQPSAIAPAPEPLIGWTALSPEVQTAVREAIAATEIAPNGPEPRLHLAMVYHGNELPQEAIETYRQVVELDPESARAWYGLGLLLDRSGQNQEALTAMSQARKFAPAYPPVHWKAGYMLLEQGRPREAIELFNATLRIEATSPAARIGLARAALVQNQLETAVRVIQSLKEDVESPYLDYLLAQTYRRLGRKQDAAMLLGNGQVEPPRFEDSWYDDVLDTGASRIAGIRRIDRLVNRGFISEALVEVRRQLEEVGDDLALLNRLDNILWTQGKIDASIRALKRSLRANNEHAPTHLNLSYRYHQQNKLVKAKQHALKATELNPNMADAHYQMGLMLLLEKELPSAVRSMDRAFRLGMQNTDARLQYAHALTRIKRFDDSLKQYNLILVQDQSNGRCWAGVADVLLIRGNLDGAIKAVQTGMQRAPESPHVQAMAKAVQKAIRDKASPRQKP